MPGLVSITTPAASTRLTTVAAARDEIGITDTSSDLKISGLIDRASAIISNYCGVTFGATAVTETFHMTTSGGRQVGPYGSPLCFVQKPLILTGVPVDVVSAVVENGATLDPALPDYEYEAGSGLLYRLRSGNRSYWSAPLVLVSYTYGYGLPYDAVRTLPFDVEDVCLALVRAGWFAQGRDPNIAMDMLNGDRTQFWERSAGSMALDDDLKAQLCGYVARAW